MFFAVSPCRMAALCEQSHEHKCLVFQTQTGGFWHRVYSGSGEQKTPAGRCGHGVLRSSKSHLCVRVSRSACFYATAKVPRPELCLLALLDDCVE